MASYGSGFELARDTLPEVRTHLELWPVALPESGSLTDTPVALLLARARLLRATGVLGLRGERFIYLSRGLPVFVDSILTGDASEVHLVNAGLLQARALDATRAHAAEQGTGVGEALLSMGVISPTDLFEHKRHHTRQRLVDCLGWTKGTARFEDRKPFGPEIVPIPIDLAQVLAEGVAAHYDAKRLARELPVGESHRVYLAGPAKAADGFALGPLEARVLSRAAARPSLATLAMDMRIEEPALHASLFVLFHLGLVGFDLSTEDAAPSRAPSPGPPEVVRPRMPSPRAPVAAVRLPTPAERAAVRVPTPAPPAATPRPPRTTPSPAAPEAELPELPADKGGAPRRALPPLGRPTRSAAGYLEDAELARDGEDLDAALLALRYANLVEPANPSIMAELAYTFLLVDERAFAREAGRLARDARRANASLPMPYVVLGMLMEQLRDSARAVQLYRYALARDPGCEPAKERLDRIDGRRRR